MQNSSLPWIYTSAEHGILLLHKQILTLCPFYFRSTECSDVMQELSYRSTDSSGDADEQTCHQCQRSDRDNVIWCRRCDRGGYCESCIYKWYVKFIDTASQFIETYSFGRKGWISCYSNYVIYLLGTLISH